MEIQMVIFRLGNENFGVDIASVESIIKLQDITRMPQTPAYMEGITNLRGKILPVMDLRQRLGMHTGERTIESRIVVANIPPLTVGLMVDSVEEVVSVDDSVIEPPPSITTSLNAEFIRGIAKSGQTLIILLNLEKVLNTGEKERTDVQPVSI